MLDNLIDDVKLKIIIMLLLNNWSYGRIKLSKAKKVYRLHSVNP